MQQKLIEAGFSKSSGEKISLLKLEANSLL
jgi:hypothetical protein